MCRADQHRSVHLAAPADNRVGTADGLKEAQPAHQGGAVPTYTTARCGMEHHHNQRQRHRPLRHSARQRLGDAQSSSHAIPHTRIRSERCDENTRSTQPPPTNNRWGCLQSLYRRGQRARETFTRRHYGAIGWHPSRLRFSGSQRLRDQGAHGRGAPPRGDSRTSL